ncbi:MAG: ribosome biogenesis GTPase YqeH [Longicatena sp.]
MSKICKGCGVVLQTEDKTSIGFTPKIEADYCQRCFRIRHYDDVVISMKQGIDSDVVLNKINKLDALILWVVDLFDFEANMVSGMNRHLSGKDIILVATKRDILPDTVGNEKLSQFMVARLKELGIYVKGIIICGDLVKHANDEYNDSIEQVEKGIDKFRKGRDVVVMGMANAGKSTLLNALCHNADLTTSRHPGTTLDFNEIKREDYVLYDTPGLTRYDSLLTHIDDSLLKSIIPLKPLKARVYQLRENQTLSLGGLVRLDLIGCSQVSAVAYFSERLNIHRSKQENADALWEQHFNELLAPVLDEKVSDMQVYEFSNIHEKSDIVIHGLGWFCVSGNIKQIRVSIPKNGNVTFRKAMI